MKVISFVLMLCFVVISASAYASSRYPLDIDLRADAVPVVGNEGIVTATVTLQRDLPNLTVEITLASEGKIAGQSRWEVNQADHLAPLEFDVKVLFTTPGTKTVRAVVKSTERAGVVWSDVAYLMLDVNSALSSVITDTSRLRTAPRLVSSLAGTRIGRPSAEEAAVRSTLPTITDVLQIDEELPRAGEPMQSNSNEIIITGQWKYTDRAGNAVGQKNNLVELRKSGLFNVVLATAYTDWDGYFEFPAVVNPGVGMYVRCYTFAHYPDYGGSVKYNSVSDYYSADTDVYIFTQNGTQSIGDWCVDNSNPNYKAWWILDDMTKASIVPPNRTGGHHVIWSPTSNGWAHYEVGGDIHLYSGDADDTPDTVLHEMGHSVMYNIYDEYMPESTNCNPHELMGDSSVGCAWTEGWAQIWHMWTTNDPIRNYPGGGGVDLEAATWSSGGDEGSDVEGRVAAALWDIADSVNDGYDNISDGWDNIWHIMYNHNCDTFYQFWNQWQSHGFNTHGAVAAIYQNTIDWNTPLTFQGLPDITLAEDEFRQNAIDLDNFASDVESQDYQLDFNIVSVSTPNLQIGIDSNHEVNMQGVANWNGTATVQVSCSDGVVAVTDSFNVTVTPVNDAPDISHLPDLTMDEDQVVAGTIYLNTYSSDPETPTVNLTYTITGNTNPSCGVSLIGGSRINVNPVANWSGTSDVQIRATDPQGLWSEDTFRITVNPVNDPPVISALPNQNLNEDASINNAIDMWAYTNDIEIPASALTYTIHSTNLPAGSVVIDSNRYIDIIPPENLNGSYTVTVRAWDFENGYGEATFAVAINSSPDAPVISGIPDQMYATTKTSTTQMVDLYQYSSDPDGPVSDLTFSITSNSNPLIGVSIYQNRYLRIAYGSLLTGLAQIMVRATDPTGGWNDDKLNVVIGRMCENCSEAGYVADGGWVIFDQNTVTISHAYAFYIEDDDRVSGIRVDSTLNPDEGRLISLGGQMTTYGGERAVDCSAYVLGDVDPTPPQALFMPNHSLGGEHPAAYTPKVPTVGNGGLYNIGLLVKTTGKVVSRTSNSFWIDDGSRVPYSLSTKGLYVDCQPIAMYAPPLGSRVAVTGTSGAVTVGTNIVNALRLRGAADVKGLGGRAAYIYQTAPSTAAVYASILNQNGWNTTLVSLSLLLSTDLEQFDVIIIGADTGTWTDTGKVNYLVDSDKPIIAFGSGGARFLDQAPNLYIGWNNSSSESLKQGYVGALDSIVYWWENTIPVPTNRILDLLVSNASTTKLNNLSTGVTGILRHPSDSAYWIVAQEGRFMQWGFDTLPANMNQTAKDLLINCIYYMQGK